MQNLEAGWISLPCRMAGWALCATQQRAEAASKCSPWQHSAHTGSEPRVPGAGAAWPLSLHSGPLKGVKSPWLIITIICKCASCSRAVDAFDLWCCKRLQLLCRLRWGDVKRCPLPSAYTHTHTKYDFAFLILPALRPLNTPSERIHTRITVSAAFPLTCVCL